MRATAVIGANFGDEGKGLLTDYLAAQDPAGTVVVRFNGGAQAGHTVITPAGRRHVFHHFGSGSLAGARTFLSRHFIVNPFLWDKERKELPDLALPMHVDRRAMLTTPFDMLVNQEAERFRGNHRHGSCGIGINETVERCGGPLATVVADIDRPTRLRELLEGIAERSLSRLEQLAVAPSPFFLEMVRSEALVASYLELCDQFRWAEHLVDGPAALPGFRHVVFEGAQGLLLDERHRFFPHVTRSRTGIHNVARIAAEVGLQELEVVYVTRTYLTRHGAGPFPTERPGLSFPDPTNAPNEWQGALRFGDLDIPLMAESIANDLSDTGGLRVAPYLAVTCLDQVPGAVPVRIADACGLPLGYSSLGPSRDRVTTWGRLSSSAGPR
ncbi:MAG TPA: adenylosuccinate synthetase [Gemmataceae bacterium]|nr:adenylosuccinate synthetase [Gemmataceae bacterium]